MEQLKHRDSDSFKAFVIAIRAAAGTRVLASTRFQKRIDSYFITRVPVKFFFYATECISMVTQLVTRKI